MNTTGRRLKRIRKLHGCTSTAELAALCGVSTVTLWRWVTGESVPSRFAEARLRELEASGPTEGIGSASSGRATAGADSSAPQVSPSTSSSGARRYKRRGGRAAEPSHSPATTSEE